MKCTRLNSMPEPTTILNDEEVLLKLLLSLSETTDDRTTKGIALSLFRRLTEERYS